MDVIIHAAALIFDCLFSTYVFLPAAQHEDHNWARPCTGAACPGRGEYDGKSAVVNSPLRTIRASLTIRSINQRERADRR